jgi:hypothetical protein
MGRRGLAGSAACDVPHSLSSGHGHSASAQRSVSCPVKVLASVSPSHARTATAGNQRIARTCTYSPLDRHSRAAGALPGGESLSTFSQAVRPLISSPFQNHRIILARWREHSLCRTRCSRWIWVTYPYEVRHPHLSPQRPRRLRCETLVPRAAA